MKIKVKIQTIIANYITDRVKYEADLAALEASNMYSAEYKGQLRDAMNANFKQTLIEADKQLMAIFQDAVDSFKSKKKNSAEFHANVTTALSYIGAMGENINDQMAFDLIHPLLGDYQTMNRLYLVLSDKVDPDTKTMYALTGYVDAVDMLEDMKSKYENTFSKIFSPETPVSIQLLGNSYVTTGINKQMALDEFSIFIMRAVEDYERHIDAVEDVYLTPSNSVEKLFSKFPLPIATEVSDKIQADPEKALKYIEHLNGKSDVNVAELFPKTISAQRNSSILSHKHFNEDGEFVL